MTKPDEALVTRLTIRIRSGADPVVNDKVVSLPPDPTVVTGPASILLMTVVGVDDGVGEVEKVGEMVIVGVSVGDGLDVSVGE